MPIIFIEQGNTPVTIIDFHSFTNCYWDQRDILLHGHEADLHTISVYTFNALHVSVSSSLGCTCMVVRTQMRKMMGLVPYVGYFFGHMTIWACTQCEYPHGFCLQDDWQGIFDDCQSTLAAWLCLHFTSSSELFTLNHSGFTKIVFGNGFNACLMFSQRKSTSQLRTFRQATCIFGKLPLYSSWQTSRKDGEEPDNLKLGTSQFTAIISKESDFAADQHQVIPTDSPKTEWRFWT